MHKLKLMILLLIIATDVVYQIAYKQVNATINTLSVIFAVYFMAFIGAVVLGFVADKLFKLNTKKTYYKNKTTYFMALSMIFIDLTYLLIYRFGGELSKVFTLTVPLQAIALLMIGILLFKENLTRKNVIGLIVGIMGVVLLTI